MIAAATVISFVRGGRANVRRKVFYAERFAPLSSISGLDPAGFL
jgi:hypothetical protein